MNTKERCIFFGIGVLLGCFILVFSSSAKFRAVQNQKETDRLNGYNPSQSVLPGQDLTARKPFETGPALAIKDSPLAEDQTFTRILIAKGSGTDAPFWRIEETLWRDLDFRREKLVRRILMHADKLVVRLKEGSDDSHRLAQDLESLNIQLIGSHHGPRLYQIQLPSYDIDSVPNFIAHLGAQIPYIEKAFPFYINNF